MVSRKIYLQRACYVYTQDGKFGNLVEHSTGVCVRNFASRAEAKLYCERQELTLLDETELGVAE